MTAAARSETPTNALETMEKNQLVTAPASSWGDYDFSFSPDGKRLAFTRSISESDQDLYEISLDNKKIRRLTNDNKNIHGHSWGKDGKTIIYSSDKGGKFELWELWAGGYLDGTHSLIFEEIVDIIMDTIFAFIGYYLVSFFT